MLPVADPVTDSLSLFPSVILSRRIISDSKIFCISLLWAHVHCHGIWHVNMYRPAFQRLLRLSSEHDLARASAASGTRLCNSVEYR